MFIHQLTPSAGVQIVVEEVVVDSLTADANARELLVKLLLELLNVLVNLGAKSAVFFLSVFLLEQLNQRYFSWVHLKNDHILTRIFESLIVFCVKLFQ